MTHLKPHDDGDDALDAQLSSCMQQFDSPSASKLEHAARQQIARYQRQRRITQATIFLIGFFAISGTIRWIGRNKVDAPQVAQSPELQLDERELEALFAPPPVEPLTLLDRQQQVSYQALKQWERSR